MSTATAHRPSTPAEQAEFVQLLDLLGVERLRNRDGWQTVRCWNTNGHANDDRHPSMSINLRTCGFRCHGCPIRGGLSALREQAGVIATRDHRRSVESALTPWSVLASPGGDILAEIPAAVIADLRNRTGRHKRDRTLARNLRRVLAAVVQVMTDAERTSAVRFTQTDALELGIRAELWTDLLPVLEHVGIVVTIGQSGRTCRRGHGQRGRMLATTVTAKTDYSVTPTGSNVNSLLIQHNGVIRNGRHAATIAASQATRAPITRDTDRPTLNRRPALAELLADLDTHTRPHDIDGHPVTTGTRTIGDLVADHGPNIRRTIRTATHLGLVDRVVVAGDGLVSITDLGTDVLAADMTAGAHRSANDAAVIRDRWEHDQAHTIPALRRQAAARRLAGCDTPWKPHTPGHVVHIDTGEVLAITELRAAANVTPRRCHPREGDMT